MIVKLIEQRRSFKLQRSSLLGQFDDRALSLKCPKMPKSPHPGENAQKSPTAEHLGAVCPKITPPRAITCVIADVSHIALRAMCTVHVHAHVQLCICFVYALFACTCAHCACAVHMCMHAHVRMRSTCMCMCMCTHMHTHVQSAHAEHMLRMCMRTVLRTVQQN